MKSEKELLREWKVAAELPANFNSEVWRRIERERAFRPAEAVMRWIAETFSRPAVAGAYVTVALGLGLLAGTAAGEKERREQTQDLRARYVQSVDPYARMTP